MIKKVLIFDSSNDVGHHWEYINHLINSAKDNTNENIQYYLLLNKDMYPKLSTIDGINNINISYINKSDSKLINRSLLLKTFYEIKYINHFTHKFGINTVIFLVLDYYQIALGLKYWLRNVEVKGIYFKPYLRRSKYFGKVLSNFYYIKKHLIFNWMLRNDVIKRIWVLNDVESANELNILNHCSKFTYLPDPIYIPKNQLYYDLKNRYSISQEQKILLVFGVISKIKNLETILRTYFELIKSNPTFTLLIVGKWNSSKYKSKILSAIKGNFNAIENTQIVIDDRYIDENEIKTIFEQIDVVLMPYKKFYYSSSVLGHAAYYNKPVLVSSTGLTADIVKKYGLGYSADPNDYNDIIIKLSLLFNNNLSINKLGRETYVNDHTIKKFTDQILND